MAGTVKHANRNKNYTEGALVRIKLENFLYVLF